MVEDSGTCWNLGARWTRSLDGLCVSVVVVEEVIVSSHSVTSCSVSRNLMSGIVVKHALWTVRTG